MGFAATENGLGTMCRVSQKQVVNVAQRGGIAAVLEAEAPPELRIPKRSLQRNEGIEHMLRTQISELRHLDHTIALLGWDEETMLPAAGRPERGDQLAALEGIRHTMLVSDRLGDLVEEVDAHADGNEGLKRELELLRRLRRNAIALPDDLVRHYAKAKSHSLGAWEDARIRNDYSVFAGPFEAVARADPRTRLRACRGRRHLRCAAGRVRAGHDPLAARSRARRRAQPPRAAGQGGVGSVGRQSRRAARGSPTARRASSAVRCWRRSGSNSSAGAWIARPIRSRCSPARMTYGSRSACAKRTSPPPS